MIQSAGKKTLKVTTFGPDVSSSVSSILSSIRIGIVEKTQINGKTQEIPIYRDAVANIQPMKQQMAIRKEGERSWKWFELYALPDLDLKTDDIVVLFGIGYRVMGKVDWKEYGYISYELIEHYRKYEG